ncbi:MAG: CPBP family intramembrane metalloprotease [Anaerolineales bacterium]|nr:CPBP family intramembrane metalloprotease [Anaerolineales bacterium]
MKTIANIFWNTDQNRLRAGWRFLIYFILFFMLTIGKDVLVSSFNAAPLPKAIAYLIYLASGLILTWGMARFIDHRLFTDFGFHFDRKWWLDLGFGLILGAFLMTGIFLSMKLAGWILITGYASTASGLPINLAFLLQILMFTVISINEELAFRAYQLKNLAEGFAGKHISSRPAILFAFLFSSALFGISHMANGHATVFSVITTIFAGLSLCLPYMLTGELGISIGLHLTWNLFQANVYGFAVSGSTPATHLLSIEVVGPSAWTGGVYGPEVGLIGLVWALIGCGLTLLWVRWLRNKTGLHIPLAGRL